MFPPDPSDVALILDLGIAAFFAIYFATGKPRVWYRDRLGWVIFGYALSVVALLGLIVYGIVFGQKVAEPIRLVVATALAAALIAKTWSVHRERRAGRLAGDRPRYSRKASIMSNSTVPASPTPNVVIENPKIRKAVRTGLDVVGGVAFIAQVADAASPAFDIGAITIPVLAAYAAARVVFGFVVDNTNTPKA